MSDTIEIQAQIANLTEDQRSLLLRRLMTQRAAAAKDRAIPSRKQHGPCPLSFGQELMWLLEQLTPGMSAYNSPGVRRVVGQLNVSALQESLDALVARHEILRTTFHFLDNEPVQLIGDFAPVHMPYVDLRHLHAPEREVEAMRLIVAEAQRPFDLTRDLMLRALLIRLDAEEHLMLFAMHHIATDGWSKEIMFKELGAFYASFCEETCPVLPEMSLQFADFAVWQREWLQGETLEKQLSYWRRQLADAPSTLELPTDFPRPAIQSFDGAHQRMMFSNDVADRLKALSQAEGATMFMALLAVFSILLSRYTGQEDIVVGSPIAGRNRSEIEGIIGYFSNTLAIRTDLSGNPTFRQLLGRVRQTALSAFDHQDLPFEKLVVELKPDRDMSYTPIVQVAFILHNRALGHRMQLPGVSLIPVEIDRGSAKFDLTLSLLESDDGLLSSCEYATSLFSQSTILSMLGHYESLLKAVVAKPDLPISDLQMLTGEEYARTVTAWNTTDSAYPEARLHELFERQVDMRPFAPAVKDGARKLTYANLEAQSNQLARYLRKAGVGPGVPVCSFFDRSLEMCVGLLGILKAGGVCVPLDPTYPRDRLHFMLEDCKAGFVVTLTPLRHALPKHSAAVICLDEDLPAIAQQIASRPQSNGAPTDPAYILYTSGSTGQPRGVVLTHRGLVNHTTAAIALYNMDSSDRVLQFSSPSFDICLEELYIAFSAGAAVVLRDDSALVDGQRFVDWIEGQSITVLDLPTAVWHEWVGELSASGHGPPESLRLVVVGGEKALSSTYAVWDQINHGRVSWINTYGPTETSVVATAYEPAHFSGGSSSPLSDIPIGRPIANVQVYVLDRHLNPAPVGVPGELYIGGTGVAQGYLNRPELTAERFIPNPFSSRSGARLYKTGDKVRWKTEGNLEFLGRLDQQVKIRGFRVEPGEIESTLNRHPDVREAVVEVVQDARTNKWLIAYVVPQSDSMPPTSSMRDFLQERLPHYMVPSVFVTLQSIPLTPNGKVDRKALPRPDLGDNCGKAAYVAPRTPLEELVAGVWSELLHVVQVSVEDNFFDLGGHSLLATQVLSRVREAIEVQLTLRSFFEYPTIAGLALAIIENLAACDGA